MMDKKLIDELNKKNSEEATDAVESLFESLELRTARGER